jgi:hypothetical protein
MVMGPAGLARLRLAACSAENPVILSPLEGLALPSVGKADARTQALFVT